MASAADPIDAILGGAGKPDTGARDVLETVPRKDLVLAQTPQVFRTELLREAHNRARSDGFVGTDDAQLVERLGHPVTVVPGSSLNLKITTREDLRLAEQALTVLPKPRLEGPAHPFAGDDLWR